uniref:Uncharacterized protein n=1 Tax=Anguilla anguilla TaxID=7936 RepID=A0A0E9XJU9_ANGAN
MTEIIYFLHFVIMLMQYCVRLLAAPVFKLNNKMENMYLINVKKLCSFLVYSRILQYCNRDSYN